MAMVWASLLVSGVLCISSQYINVNEKDDCASHGEVKERIKGLLKQQERIQKSVDSLIQMVNRLDENMTRIHKDVQIVKKELILDVVDCQDLFIKGYQQSGQYTVYPCGIQSPVNVYCDMVTERGGWTVIQKRVSGDIHFDRTWAEYKNGFGHPNDSYWIGNDVIYQFTKGRNSSLYVSITLINGTRLYELYNQFSVADETNNYRLFLGGPATGTLVKSNKDLSGMYFSTPDRDNDGRRGDNCAAYSTTRGGWWFNSCRFAFLNGQWSPGNWVHPWYPAVTDGREIKETFMMIKHL